MLLLILSLFDMLAGIIVSSSSHIMFPLFIVKSLFIYYLLKGTWSVFSSIMNKYFFDWMGAIDVIAAICLYYIYAGNIFDIFSKIGILIILKGIYSFIFSIK